MTAYYVASDGNNSDGLTWAKAFTTFAGAVSAATASGDIIYVDQGFTDTLAADAAYTFLNNVNVICSNDKANEPPQTLGSMGTSNWIGHTSSAYSITINGGYNVFIRGITFRNAGSTSKSLTIGTSNNTHFEFENCYFWLGNTNSSASIIIGGSSSSVNTYNKLKGCIFRFSNAGQQFAVNNLIEFMGCSVSADGTAPNVLFEDFSRTTYIQCVNCDFSVVTGTLIGDYNSISPVFVFANCKLGSGFVALGTQSVTNKSAGSVALFNCASGDQHYQLGHFDSFGSTIVDTGIYANDGAQYDGTNRCSWKIVTTVNCSYYTPYVSPWIDCYHSGTSAITPSLEILRDGSTTPYQDDEVWSEFSYQGTSGSPLGITVSDRKGLLASAADQAAGVGTSGWTGDTGAWSGKLSPTASITPAEIGHLRARVCVGEPSITVYVCPTIRGRS